MKNKTKSLAKLLNESNTHILTTIKEEQDRINLADGGFSEGVKFKTRLGTLYLDVSDITGMGVTLQAAFTPKGGKLDNDSEVVQVTIFPDGRIQVVDRTL